MCLQCRDRRWIRHTTAAAFVLPLLFLKAKEPCAVATEDDDGDCEKGDEECRNQVNGLLMLSFKLSSVITKWKFGFTSANDLGLFSLKWLKSLQLLKLSLAS